MLIRTHLQVIIVAIAVASVKIVISDDLGRGGAFYAEVRDPRQGATYVLPPSPLAQAEGTIALPMIVACSNPAAEVCVHILRDASIVVLPRSCFACSRTDLQLTNLNAGSYKLSIEGPDGFLSQTHFEVAAFQGTSIALLPRIEAPTSIELQVDPPTYNHDVMLVYNLVDGAEGVNAHINVCIEMTNTNGDMYLSQTCVSPSQNRLTLQNVPEGDYISYLYLRTADAVAQRLPAQEGVVRSSVTKVEVRLHRATDFVPSYGWQRIHVWDRVQAGLDIRLPMSAAGGEKVARIPEPWRLQAQLPSGAGDPSRPGAAGAFHCKAFFLRMDVHRRTSLLDVKKAAIAQCRAPPVDLGTEGSGNGGEDAPPLLRRAPRDPGDIPRDAQHCLAVVIDGERLVLPDDDLVQITSESHGLFNKKISIEVMEDCQ